ncbi:hypothetical protein [Budvicia aquatica]|uniref:Uncharacterized protein n=1 Tax=Budvicia aquatica TaxID=82979 RepID=A0A484ZTS7_9GAMM|nr:hypothetical protein [Budvicia aquatica]VFS50733.1 Uncharacterised protein [Budvicia aquatica]
MSNVESSRCDFEEIKASLADVASHTTGPIITDTTRGKRDDIPDTRDHAVIQKINHDAAEYCSCILFMNKDRLSYQTETRQHPEELLKQEKVGYTNGRVSRHLLRLGHDPEDIISSGLAIRYQNKIIDALPLNCFVYPFYDLDNNIGRFTTKDPIKLKCINRLNAFGYPILIFGG